MVYKPLLGMNVLVVEDLVLPVTVMGCLLLAWVILSFLAVVVQFMGLMPKRKRIK